jgi:exosome complex component MTR3
MLADCYFPETQLPGDAPIVSPQKHSYPLHLESGLIHNVSGSIYLELGTTKVICSINGPITSNKKIFSNIGQLECNIKYTSSAALQNNASLTTEAGGNVINTQVQPSMIIDALEGSIRLEKYPKTIIVINLVVLETSGFELGPMITCASLALIDAAIEVIDLVCASSLSRIPSSSSFIPFPSTKVSSTSTGTEICDVMTVATIPSQNVITQLWFDGMVENVVMQDMINACCVFNKELRGELRKKLLQKLAK